MIVLSGCSGLPKTAKLNISFAPNPVLEEKRREKIIINFYSDVVKCDIYSCKLKIFQGGIFI
jgi:hypothetical protein